ncbi:MAG TPA: Crp/Fnr family transcriptional regulator [Patescibacteria group bacterium]|nr:Crp/Fnr family transcriptional regulator [Patescibacteria group bacterium]
MDAEKKVEILKQFDLFKNLEEEAIDAVAAVAKEKNFGPKETIIQEGEAGTDIYLIYEGSVRIYRLSEDGKEATLSINGHGDIIGEMAIFDHGVRTAFVEALETTKTLCLTETDFKNLMVSHGQVAIELLNILSGRLLENGKLIEKLETKSLKDRVKSVLLTLDSYMPKIKITQEQLASLVGATRPRVSESLGSLKKEGFLEMKEHELHVLKGTE